MFVQGLAFISFFNPNPFYGLGFRRDQIIIYLVFGICSEPTNYQIIIVAAGLVLRVELRANSYLVLAYCFPPPRLSNIYAVNYLLRLGFRV